MSVYEWLPCEKCGRDVSVQFWINEKSRGGQGLCDFCRDGRKGPPVTKKTVPEGWRLGEGGQNRGKNPDENPETPASSEPENNPEKPARNLGKKRPFVETWLFVWGEVEQQRILCGDLASVQISTDAAGKSRGGYSLPDSLLIHSAIDGALRSLGKWAYDMVAKAYVHGWSWEEATKVEEWADGTKTLIRLGSYYRKPKPGTLKQHQERTVKEISRDLARLMGLRWREEKNEKKDAA